MSNLRFPTKKEFTEYLENLQESNVTKFCKNGACPIAQWFIDSGQVADDMVVIVDGDSAIVRPKGDWDDFDFDSNTISAPRWAEKFIEMVDDNFLDPKLPEADWGNVTPVQALWCLNPARGFSG